MTCDDADLLLATAAVGDLAADDAGELADHLEGCRRCRGAGAGYAETAGLLPLALRTLEPPPELRSRIMARVHADAMAAPSRPAPAGGRGRGRLRRLWTRLPASRGFGLAAAGVAAACAIALAVVLATANHQAQPTPGAAAVRLPVGGTTAQPSASGTLVYDPSTRQAVLTVQGLPEQLPVAGQPTRTYEVWLVRPGGAAVPAAFLALQPDGRTWTAAMTADISAYAYVAATVEPAGGSQTPTGAEVIHVALPQPATASA